MILLQFTLQSGKSVKCQEFLTNLLYIGQLSYSTSTSQRQVGKAQITTKKACLVYSAKRLNTLANAFDFFMRLVTRLVDSVYCFVPS